MSRASGHGNERGIALVMVLIILLVVSVIATALMLSVQIESKISGRDDRRSQALSLAEAGIAEVISRLKSGEVPDTLNPRMTTQIFMVAPGNVPVLGTDSTALPTAQPAGHWLTYSLPRRGPEALTVTYRTDAARTRIFRYDRDRSPPIQTDSGEPIFVITSTGRKGTDTRTVVSEVIRKPYRPDIKAPVVSGMDLRFGGNSTTCGYDHRIDTPTWYGKNGRVGAQSCVPYEIGAGILPGAWSADGLDPAGASKLVGQPVADQIGFYEGPWDALGIPQADFFGLVGAPYTAVPASLRGIVYVDNDGVSQNQSGAYGIQGTAGEGVLYVDGDLNLTGPFTYRGLVYVEGNVNTSGDVWILGALVGRGKSGMKVTGGATVLYSRDAISLMLAKYAGQFVQLSWREK